jgi:PAS domain S-box-containing protein
MSTCGYQPRFPVPNRLSERYCGFSALRFEFGKYNAPKRIRYHMASPASLTESAILAPANPVKQPKCYSHRLQLYTADTQLLASNVSDYLCDGLDRGEGILVITTPRHRAAFERQMATRVSRADLARGLETGQILFLDAQNLLSRLIAGDQLDWMRFKRIMGGIMAEVRPLAEGRPCRAYGEMVGLLWTAGEFAAAEKLEQFWNKLLEEGGFQLFCAYPIDVFGAEFHSPAVDAVLHSHTHLVSSGDSDALHAAVNRAAGEVIQSWDDVVMTGTFREDVPEGEAKILWLRENFPANAGKVLKRAKQHYSSEKRFRALVENSSDAIALTDPEGRILYASPSTSRVLGYSPQEIVGRDARDFVHPEDCEDVRRAMQGVLAKPRVPLVFQLRARRKNGGWCWVEATGSNLLNQPDISAIVFNFRDIGDRKSAEIALRESEAALRNANSGLEQFAYAAAHDLQEPIRNVAIYVELLARKYRDKLDDEANELIKVAMDGALRMQTLTRDLLTFTRSLDSSEEADMASQIGNARPPADCNAVMAEVVASLQDVIRSSEANITWDDLPALPIYRAHLVQVMQNLVGNALKYRSAETPRVHISVFPRTDEWWIAVADNGVGVPAEYREQIFGMFKRLHGRDVPGSGIGLAICNRIVAHYQGSIRAEPRPGGGSIFSFTLPREKAHECKT